jgi:hypothetical protein
VSLFSNIAREPTLCSSAESLPSPLLSITLIFSTDGILPSIFLLRIAASTTVRFRSEADIARSAVVVMPGDHVGRLDASEGRYSFPC